MAKRVKPKEVITKETGTRRRRRHYLGKQKKPVELSYSLLSNHV
jgi:hypothetical protein